MTLDKLKVGESAVIKAVGGEGELRFRLLDMGLTPRAHIKALRIAPMGDPVAYELRGYELTLRLDDAKLVEVEKEESK